MSDSSLLPLNRSPLEQALAQLSEGDLALADVLRRMHSVDSCPVELLPWLAIQRSVDRWDPEWSEAIKRQVIKSSYFVHSHKGTIGSLRRVIDPLGYRIHVKEWWETLPEGVPGTFAMDIEVLQVGITEETYTLVTSLISDTKPVSRHLSGLNLIGTVAGELRLATAIYDGHETEIYPYTPTEIESAGQIALGMAIYDGDITTLYPVEPAEFNTPILITIAAAIVTIDATTVFPHV